MKVSKRVAIFILSQVLCWGGAVTAYSCSCDLQFPQKSLKRQVTTAFKSAVAVFSGTVSNVRHVEGDLGVIVTFKVNQIWKGTDQNEVRVNTGLGDGDCGYKFEPGGTYLVYAFSQGNGLLGTNVCQRTADLASASKDITFLGKYRSPKSTPLGTSKTRAGVESQTKVESEIGLEESESSDAREREARMAKNTRYNTGGTDLTVQLPKDSEIFIEQVWPRHEVAPAQESTVVLTGRVVKLQPYLSGDRSRIYTEITIAVDALLKLDRDDRLSANKTVVIDRLGGALKLKSGPIVRDEIQIDYLGKPQPGKRYVFFASGVNDGSDISLIRSYELSGGKVFTDDTGPSRLVSNLRGFPAAWGSEVLFIEAIRQEIRYEVNRLK